MLKRIWLIFGPVFFGLLLAVAIIFFYPVKIDHSQLSELVDATSLTKDNFKSGDKKVRALSDPTLHFVPFFGSSEWSRMDKMHPSVLAEAYQRSYRPYLLGQRGSASLTHYFGIQQINSQLKDRQAVYLISPQWFVRKGANASAFQNYVSTGQIVDFLQQQTGSPYDRYAAKRFLRLNPDTIFTKMMEKVAKGKTLSSSDKENLDLQAKIFEKVDSFFSQFRFVNHQENIILPQVEQLPREFSYEELEKIATQDGQYSSTNNSFGIEDEFYNKRIKNQLNYIEGSQKNFTYVQSPEYNDLQLVLNVMAKNHTDVLFVIPPVNSKWAAFTGLDLEMYEKSVAKIKYQLQSQAFDNIADFSKDGDKPYFMQDTIHMGWNGWLAMDKSVNDFISQERPAPTYRINDTFLTKEWARYEGDPSQFQP